MKKLVSMIVCVVLLMSLLPMTTFATEEITSGKCGDNLIWTFDGDSTLTISGQGDMWDVYDKTEYHHLRNKIKTVIIESGVTSIGNKAFGGSLALYNTYFYFIECVVIPEGVTKIGDAAFLHCVELTEIILPESVNNIGKSAFYGCSKLESIIMPQEVETFGSSVFQNCEKLENITLPTGIKLFRGFAGCTNLTKIKIPDGVLEISPSALSNCTNLTEVLIPDSVQTINFNAFAGCASLKNITLPEGVQTIGQKAFVKCGLETILIPSTVKEISESSFSECNNLTEIIVNENNLVYSSQDGVLFDKSKTTLYLCPNGKSGAYTVPSGTSLIEESAFSNCKKLTEVYISNGVTKIRRYAFEFCEKLEVITLAESIQIIEKGAFGHCVSLKSMKIPNGLYSIAEDLFICCNSMTSITLPDSICFVGASAFFDCYSLKDIYFEGTQTQWDDIEWKYSHLDGIESANVHILSKEALSASGVLRSGEGWSINWECTYTEDNEGNISNGEVTIQMTGSGDENDLYVFNGNAGNFSWEETPYNIPKTAIEKLTINGTSEVSLRLTTNSFKGYDNLKTFVGSYISGVDSSAFEGCSSLENVAIAYPKDNFSYGANSFRDCTNLNDVTFSQDLWHIGDGAFQNTKLGTITLYDNINDIGDDVFVGCSNIKIRCYENSVAHQYAVDNSITFELIDAYETYTIYGENGEEYIFDLTLEDFISQTTTTTYNPNLAYMLMTLCYSAYEQDNMKKSLDELGFSDTYFSYQSSLSYSLGKKTLPNGKKLVLVTVKGTQNNEEWQRNLTIDPVNTFGAAWHTGFSTGSLQIYTDLIGFCNEDFDNTTFVITGHSLGAGVANLLEVRLSDNGIAKENVYGYNFACPDVATAPSIGLDWNRFGTHDNMFNIGHAGDIVSIVPGVVGDTFLTAGKIIFTWGKFGRNYWFAYDWRDSDELNVFNFDHHLPTNYVNFLKNNKYGLNKYKNWDEKNGAIGDAGVIDIGTAIYNIFYAACPVDVIIKNSSNETIASVINDKVNYYNSNFGEVIITTYGDKKSIAVKSGQDLTVNFIATGEGTMTYSTVTTNILTDEILSEKTFENVALTTGKEMKSEINATDNGSAPDMSDVSLYVVDDRGDIVKEVLPDGTGTEVELKTITFDANGGSISTTTTKTNAEGKLTSLPTPTRSSYEFDGWYTSSTGGDKITTSTIFTQDTTVYAHWTKSSSGGFTGGGGGTTGYTIKFETNGGSKIDSVKSTGTAISEPTSPTKEGCTFNGWYTDKELTSKYDFSNKITKSFTLYAAWVENDEQEQPTTETKNPFTDVNTDDWYYNAVMFAYKNNITSGVSETEFAPQGKVTRGQFITMLCRAYEIPEMTGDNFDDCGDTWYTGYLATVKQLGISNGVGDNKFAPEKEITREEMVTLIYNYLKSIGETSETVNETSFADDNTISEWAKSSVSFASSNGYVNGKDNNIFDAQGTATRAELAQIFYNILAK